MLRASSLSNKTLVSMRRVDGETDSIVYLADGTVIKPDQGGNVLVDVDSVPALMAGGYFYSQT